MNLPFFILFDIILRPILVYYIYNNSKLCVVYSVSKIACSLFTNKLILTNALICDSNYLVVEILSLNCFTFMFELFQKKDYYYLNMLDEEREYQKGILESLNVGFYSKNNSENKYNKIIEDLVIESSFNEKGLNDEKGSFLNKNKGIYFYISINIIN